MTVHSVVPTLRHHAPGNPTVRGILDRELRKSG
jgi:hypothetical protein